jgi:hypothetical protein
MSAMRGHKSDERDERDERDEPVAKRRKAFVVYATADGEVKISPDALSYLGAMSPFFARREAQEADRANKADGVQLTDGGNETPIVHAPSELVLKCSAVVTSFVEWQQLDEGELKREYQARVAAMVRALSACPFDQTHVLRLGMADGFRDMEATLVGHAVGAVGAFGADGVPVGATGSEWYRRLTPECAGRLVGVTFPKTSGPSETRAHAVLCAFYIVKNRGAEGPEGPQGTRHECKFREIALCPRHFEIRHEANVYDDITESLVVRGRDSPHGCAIRGLEVIHGLVASAIIDLAEIDRGAYNGSFQGSYQSTRDERKAVSYKDTATVLGIMRIQKARLQNTAPLLVEFLDAVALELANV